MRHYATIMNNRSARTGRTLKAYNFISNTNGYSATLSPVTFTEVGQGVYYLEVTASFRATVGIVLDDNSFYVTQRGVWLEGDNEPSYAPTT